MKYYRIDTDWDENLDSPWDAIWDEPDIGSLDCLKGSLPLAAIWRAPQVTLEKRLKSPDIYSFVLNYAVTERVRELLAPIVLDEAEFLPLDVVGLGTLYAIHPLWPVDFDERAQVSCNEISGNVTVVRRYSFTIDPDQYDGPRHMFRMRQAKGSAARDGGYTCNAIIVSEKIRRAAEKAELQGVAFRHVCTA